MDICPMKLLHEICLHNRRFNSPNRRTVKVKSTRRLSKMREKKKRNHRAAPEPYYQYEYNIAISSWTNAKFYTPASYKTWNRDKKNFESKIQKTRYYLTYGRYGIFVMTMYKEVALDLKNSIILPPPSLVQQLLTGPPACACAVCSSRHLLPNHLSCDYHLLREKNHIFNN